jgi:DNA-binding MltR family transcriptional regulator
LAAALISVARIETGLVTMLSNFLIEGSTSAGMLDVGGILGDLASCSKMAYCLGLISKAAYQEIDQLGRIRNIFAHSRQDLDFSNKDVAEACEKLQGWRLAPQIPWTGQEIKTTKDKFIAASFHVLEHVATYSAVKRRQTFEQAHS